MCLDRKCGLSQGRARTVSASVTIRVPASELLVVVVVVVVVVVCCVAVFGGLQSINTSFGSQKKGCT